MRDPLNYRKFILEELRRRQKKNPAYSLRAFSRDLDMNSSRLSEVLNGKVGISEKRAVKIAERMKMDERTKAFFVDLVQSEHSRSSVERKSAASRIAARHCNLQETENIDIASTVFSLNTEQIAYAKNRFQEFQLALVTELQGISGNSTLYRLSLRLFEVAGDKK